MSDSVGITYNSYKKLKIMKYKLLCVLKNNILTCTIYNDSVILYKEYIAGLNNTIFARKENIKKTTEKIIQKGNWFRKHIYKYETKIVNTIYYIRYAGKKYEIKKSEYDELLNLYNKRLKEKQEKELDILCNENN